MPIQQIPLTVRVGNVIAVFGKSVKLASLFWYRKMVFSGATEKVGNANVDFEKPKRPVSLWRSLNMPI